MPTRAVDEYGNPINSDGSISGTDMYGNPTGPVGPTGTKPVSLTAAGRAAGVTGTQQTNNLAQPPPVQGPTSLTPVQTDASWAVAPGGLPSQGTSLYQAFQSGLTGEAAVQWANSANGGQGGYAYYPDKNVYALPTGGYVGANGGGGYFYAPGDSGGSPSPPGATAGTINATTNTPTASAGQPDAITAATQAAILAQLTQAQTPISGSSSTVTAITDPYNQQAQQGLAQTKEALAEQAYAGGNLNTGGYANSQIAANENTSANEANFTGQTVATQEAARQAMLQNLLGLGTNVSEFSQQLSDTQKNFADQLAQQNSQFNATLAHNVAQWGQTLGYQYALLAWTQQQAGINGSTTPVTTA